MLVLVGFGRAPDATAVAVRAARATVLDGAGGSAWPGNGPSPGRRVRGRTIGVEFVDGGVQDGVYDSSVAALFEISSKSACTFPWTLMTASAWASLVRSRSFSARRRATSWSDGTARVGTTQTRLSASLGGVGVASR